MKHSLFLGKVFLPVLFIFVGVSCKKQHKDIIPSAEFAPYVSAYTGGVISSHSSVRLELTEEQEIIEMGAEVKEKLFTFSPSLKGKTFWVNNKTLEFIPDSGALKPGTLYHASFALGKILDVDKSLQKFDFSFRVQERNFVARIRSLDITESASDKVTVRGEIRFSDIPNKEAIPGMFTVSYLRNTFPPVIEATDDPHKFDFTIRDIPKNDEDTRLEIQVSGKKIGMDKKDTQEVIIPALRPFKLLSAEMIHNPENGMLLTFSDPVSRDQDLEGMIVLEGISDHVFLVEDNKIHVFFERRQNNTTINARIDKGLKNSNNESLNASSSVSLKVASLDPQVEILSSGTIMPNSQNLILPFRAVSLYAVDVKVIRIFESNVLMFLQNNSLNSTSSYELRRAGRLVYKKMLRLDSDPTKDIREWENYFIDLSQIIRQEPGAIYRIELSFRQAYSAYPCGEGAVAYHLQQSDRLTRLESGEMTEDDEAVWDIPNTYYYDDFDIDWEQYDWRERDNPCHASYYMNSDRRAVANVLASNLGVIVKANSNNDLWVSVTHLLDTKPVANAEVTAYNFQLQPVGSAKTDQNGFAVLKAKNKPFVVTAVSGDQKAYIRLVDGEENMVSRFDVGGKEIKKGLKGYIYGERGVWRPGDTLYLSFMMEDREHRIPDNHPVSIEVYNPRGQFYYKKISVNGINGLYTFAVPTKADDPTGLWNAYVKVGGTSFHKSLRIETVKPNRLKINVEIPGNKLLSTVPQVPVTIRSSWLTGATARNLKTKMEITLSKTATQFKGYEKYIFNNPATDFTSTTLSVFDGKLNDQGVVTFNMKLPVAKDAPGMLRASLSCQVYEPGGDVSFYNEVIPFSPFGSYVGIRFNEGKAGTTFETDVENFFDVVTVDPDGKLVSRSDLEYKIYKIGWSWWWEHNDESFSSYINNTSVKPVTAGTLKTVNGKARIRFKVDYPEWGRYLVFVKDRESGHATGGTVYVDWPEWRGRSQKTDPGAIKMLTFSTDKSSYEVGENVTVMIPSSSEGRALVALENGSEVMRREWIEVSASGDTRYSFKVTEDMAPNIYVHISLLQPHEQTVNDLPIRMYGVAPVFVTNKASVLSPQIAMADVLRPETEFTVRVKEKNGIPMTYTLAVVDEGLLDLTSFKTPDPWNEFYAREALGIRTWDMFDLVIGAFAGKYGSLFSIGGDGELKPAKKANRFKPVVKFIGPFILKKGEERSHKIKLPSYIGSVRVMVVAGQNGAYGNAEKTVPVRTPLMVLSSLPRVVSIDEEVALPVNVFAMENQVKNVTVKVETTGKLKLTDGNNKALTFTAPGDEMVYFSLKSGSEPGVEKVTVTATGNGQTSKETIEIDIRNPNPPVVYSENKLVAAGESAELAYHLGGISDDNWVKWEVSRIPSVDISRRLDFLYNYQHYCTEQLTSRALPLLFLSQFKDLDKKETEFVKENVREAIASLYGRQLTNGGISYWPGDGQVNDWVTSYAGVFLIMAKEKGYDVNRGVLDRWRNYQRTAARDWRENRQDRRYYYSQSDLEQAYRLYSLALSGSPEIGAMNRLKEKKDLSLQARWSLAAAYALAGRANAAEELIRNSPTSVSPYAFTNSTYGSSGRDEAMILEALVLLGHDREAFTQARKVSENLSRENYFTTQSSAYALMAMGRLAEKIGGSLDFDWTLNGSAQPSVKSAKALFQRDIPVKPLKGKITLKNNGTGMLYVNVVSKTRPLRDSLPAVNRDLRMTVNYADLNGNPLDISRLSQGQEFVAYVNVSNPGLQENYTDLALTHIIPSGWEIYNERMINPGDKDNGKSSFHYQDIRDDRILTYFDLGKGQTKTFKIRLMASYAGSFVLPAIQCEAMYAPDIQARTKAGRVVVER